MRSRSPEPSAIARRIETECAGLLAEDGFRPLVRGSRVLQRWRDEVVDLIEFQRDRTSTRARVLLMINYGVELVWLATDAGHDLQKLTPAGAGWQGRYRTADGEDYAFPIVPGTDHSTLAAEIVHRIREFVLPKMMTMVDTRSFIQHWTPKDVRLSATRAQILAKLHVHVGERDRALDYLHQALTLPLDDWQRAEVVNLLQKIGGNS
jgi:hypothetical protein